MIKPRPLETREIEQLTPQEEKELLSNVYKTAKEFELNHHGCSVSVVNALSTHLKLGTPSEVKLAIKLAAPFAAGGGLRHETCGALSGAVIALGMVTGPEDPRNFEQLVDALLQAHQLTQLVETELKSTNCRTLHNMGLGRTYDLTVAEQYEAFIRDGGYEYCSDITGKTAQIAARMIIEHFRNRQG